MNLLLCAEILGLENGFKNHIKSPHFRFLIFFVKFYTDHSQFIYFIMIFVSFVIITTRC